MKGRSTGKNIRLLYDTPLDTSKYQIPGLLLVVTFEKAFDSVAWSFIENLLNVFDFRHDIKMWISTFYANIKACMSVNGQYSEWFGVKSCLLYTSPSPRDSGISRMPSSA